jgi:hypothetical protein
VNVRHDDHSSRRQHDASVHLNTGLVLPQTDPAVSSKSLPTTSFSIWFLLVVVLPFSTCCTTPNAQYAYSLENYREQRAGCYHYCIAFILLLSHRRTFSEVQQLSHNIRQRKTRRKEQRNCFVEKIQRTPQLIGAQRWASRSCAAKNTHTHTQQVCEKGSVASKARLLVSFTHASAYVQCDKGQLYFHIHQ